MRKREREEKMSHRLSDGSTELKMKQGLKTAVV